VEVFPVQAFDKFPARIGHGDADIDAVDEQPDGCRRD
jgi:hypothetical protein